MDKQIIGRPQKRREREIRIAPKMPSSITELFRTFIAKPCAENVLIND